MGRKVGIESDELLSVIYDAIGSKLTVKEAYKKYPGLDHAIRREYGGVISFDSAFILRNSIRNSTVKSQPHRRFNLSDVFSVG